MDHIVDGAGRFKSEVFPSQQALYQRLAREGQKPKAMVISCSDSRVVPEIITQSGPGDMFVARNAGNIVPTYGEVSSGITSAIEYAVVGLKVEHIVVCGHSDCGAMKAVLHPEALKEMPNVAKWLGHCTCARDVFHRTRAGQIADKDAVRQLAMENVLAQIAHLGTHPCVASRVATGDLTLHGWLFDIESGTLYAANLEAGTFAPIAGEGATPITLPGRRKLSASHLVAAE